MSVLCVKFDHPVSDFLQCMCIFATILAGHHLGFLHRIDLSTAAP